MLITLLIWVLTIFKNGTSLISLNTTFTGSFMSLTLPTQPQSIPLVYVNNTPTISLLNGTNLIIPVFGNATVYVIYVPKASVINGLVSINVTNNAILRIIIPYNYILIYNITLTLINFTGIDNQLIVMAKGPGSIVYTLAPTKPITHPVHSSFIIDELLIIIVIAVAAIASFYIMVSRHRTRHIKPVNLNEYELSIINYLKSVGGEAYEVDISRQLNMPRTTVWRTIKRLEGLGIVEVRKVHGKNLVVLKELKH